MLDDGIEPSSWESQITLPTERIKLFFYYLIKKIYV